MKDLETRDSLSSAITIGFIAGSTEAIITNPLVTIKSCLQRGVPLPWSSGIANMTTFMYRGIGARMTGIGLSVGIRIMVHDAMVHYIFESPKLSLQQEAITAVGTGFCSAFFNTPFELGMTLQQTDPNKRADNFLKTLRNVQTKWGVKKSFSGFSCIFGRDVIVTSGFLNFTPKFKEYVANEYNYDSHASSLLGGTAIGTALSVLTHPLDTIKTIQQTNLRDSKLYGASSIINSAQQVFDKNGIRGFYKGLFFRAARIGPHVGIVTSMSEALTDHSNNYLRNNKM